MTTIMILLALFIFWMYIAFRMLKDYQKLNAAENSFTSGVKWERQNVFNKIDEIEESIQYTCCNVEITPEIEDYGRCPKCLENI